MIDALTGAIGGQWSDAEPSLESRPPAETIRRLKRAGIRPVHRH